MQICVSGWVMRNALPVTIEDIYQDARVPQDAYRPTFVKSLAMVPIRKTSPIGAIGNYWASNYKPSDDEIAVLQALADTTSVALENADLYSQLQHKVTALQESNNELAHFAWVASHDLQEPLRTISIQMELLKRQYGKNFDERAQNHVDMAIKGSERLQKLINDLLVHADMRNITEYQPVDMNQLMAEVLDSVHDTIIKSGAQIAYAQLPVIYGDPIFLLRVMMNLVVNAIKFCKQGERPQILVTAEAQNECWLFAVKDNGIGIEARFLDKIFGYFQRLNSREQYEGSGIGLATAKKIINMHGGIIWAEKASDGGSIFKFTIPTIIKVGKA